MNLLSLQPALRTLTSDYNSLKRQVQDFPFMLDKAITEAKQEVSERPPASLPADPKHKSNCVSVRYVR